MPSENNKTKISEIMSKNLLIGYKHNGSFDSMSSAKFCDHYYPAKFKVSFDFVSAISMLDLMQKVAKVRKGKESFSKDA